MENRASDRDRDGLVIDERAGAVGDQAEAAGLARPQQGEWSITFDRSRDSSTEARDRCERLAGFHAGADMDGSHRAIGAGVEQEGGCVVGLCGLSELMWGYCVAHGYQFGKPARVWTLRA